MDNDQLAHVRQFCLNKARDLHRYDRTMTHRARIATAAALGDFVLSNGGREATARMEALSFVKHRPLGAAPNLAVILAQASAYAAFLVSGVTPSFGADFLDEPQPNLDDGLRPEPPFSSDANGGQSGGSVGIQGALDAAGGGLDGGDELGGVGHGESSAEACGGAATVGEAVRISNDPTGGRMHK
jgi:hypothetical protein